MGEALAGVVGGLGLFIVGMNMLTENLKALVGRRIRKAAQRLTRNATTSVLLGLAAGTITQSMAGATFITVSLLRGGLIDTRTALALCIGASAGVTTLVLLVTLDAETVALCVLGVSAAVIASEAMVRYRSAAAAAFGAALLILGLIVLQEAVIPIAEQPWVRHAVSTSSTSLIGIFLVCTVLTALVQSSSAICVVLIGLSSVGIVSDDQVMAGIYSCGAAAALSIYVLSSGLEGKAKQLSMAMVWYCLAISVVAVALLFVEIAFEIALVKALVIGGSLPMEQKLALLYISLGVVPMPAAIAVLGPAQRALQRRYAESTHDQIARPRYLHEQAHGDADSAHLLAQMELRRALEHCSAECEAVRQGEPVAEIRDAIAALLNDIEEFLKETARVHPRREHERRNALVNRTKALQWLNQSLAQLCETLGAPVPATWLRNPVADLKDTLRESADAALMTLTEALKADDEFSWDAAHRVTRDRSELMSKVRSQYVSGDSPFNEEQIMEVLLVTGHFEEFFHAIKHLEKLWNPNTYE